MNSNYLAWGSSISCLNFMVGEGNGNPLQDSCLENPRDGGAWWAAVYEAAQSQTQLSDLAAAAATPRWRNLTNMSQVIKVNINSEKSWRILCWSGLCASTVRGTDLISGQGTKIPHDVPN